MPMISAVRNQSRAFLGRRSLCPKSPFLLHTFLLATAKEKCDSTWAGSAGKNILIAAHREAAGGDCNSALENCGFPQKSRSFYI